MPAVADAHGKLLLLGGPPEVGRRAAAAPAHARRVRPGVHHVHHGERGDGRDGRARARSAASRPDGAAANGGDGVGEEAAAAVGGLLGARGGSLSGFASELQCELFSAVELVSGAPCLLKGYRITPDSRARLERARGRARPPRADAAARGARGPARDRASEWRPFPARDDAPPCWLFLEFPAAAMPGLDEWLGDSARSRARRRARRGTSSRSRARCSRR